MTLSAIQLAFMIVIPYFLFGIAFWAKSVGKPKWFIRKLIHTFGLSILSIYGGYIETAKEIIMLTSIFLVILIILTIIPQIQLIQKLIAMGTRDQQRELESLINSIMTSISVFILLAVFIDHRWVFMGGVFAVALGDGLGEFVGRPYGKHKYKIFGEKSVEGSIGVFFGTLVGIVIPIMLFHPITLNINVIVIIVLISFGSAIIEGLSVSFMDNVVMPFFVGGMLWLNFIR